VFSLRLRNQSWDCFFSVGFKVAARAL